MSLGQRLRGLREDRGWTQTEVADRVGVSSVTVNRYESGERNPGFEMLIALADLFRVSIDYLLGRTDVPAVHLSPDESGKPAEDFYAQPRDSVLGQLTAKEQQTYLEMCKRPQSPFLASQSEGSEGMSDDIIVALVRVLEMAKTGEQRPGRAGRKRKTGGDGEQ